MQEINIIILAAGAGSRMKSSLPKAMHLLGGVPLIGHLIYKSKFLGAKKVVSVIGKDMPSLESYLTGKTQLVYQEEKLGSGHAVLCAKDSILTSNGVILVVYADTPLVSVDVLQEVCRVVSSNEADVCLVGFEKKEANAYGKLVAAGKKVKKIIEHTEATAEEKLLTICNSGIMAIKADKIWNILAQINSNNSKNEFYLTDAIAIANNMGLNCAYVLEEANNVQGANTKEELAILEGIFQNYKRKEFLAQGVQLIDPNSVYFSMDTKIGKDVVIYPNVFIGANVFIADSVVINPFSTLEGVDIKENCVIGPFARIRPNTVLEKGVHVGNFVEIKKAHLKAGVKANHLSYIGDSDIGEKTNIGAGTITCNYDGTHKHKTVIGKNCFIGSNTALVAPISIEDNATIGAGSTITKDVPSGALAVARALQRIIPNWKR